MKKLRGLFAKKKDIMKPRLLSFKEFREYVYEPSKRIKTLNLPEEERLELEEIIEERKR